MKNLERFSTRAPVNAKDSQVGRLFLQLEIILFVPEHDDELRLVILPDILLNPTLAFFDRGGFGTPRPRDPCRQGEAQFPKR